MGCNSARGINGKTNRTKLGIVTTNKVESIVENESPLLP